MATKVCRRAVGAVEAGALLVPRHGLVDEAPGTGADEAPTSGLGLPPPDGCISRSFAQVEGPLRRYRRTVEVRAREDGRYLAKQVVELRVGLPWWSWLLAPPLRLSLGKLRTTRGDRMPWWGPPERLSRRAATVLATLAALVAVQGFVAGALPETLTYAASQMGAGTFAQGSVFAAVELSALPALAALVLADRRGRRAVVLWATGGGAVVSELSALAPSIAWLATAQVAAGALVAAGGIAAVVVAVEEVPRGCRAWAVGVLGMAGGLGGGVPLALLPLAGTGPGGWRWVYALSVAALPVVVLSARRLPESQRWEGLLAAGGTKEMGPLSSGPLSSGPLSSATAWLGSPPGRLALVCAGAFLFAVFAAPAGQFQTQFLRHGRHYSPLAISVLQQVTGTLGGVGVLVGGRLADTHGRRPVAAACVAGATSATLVAYLAHGWAMWGATTFSQFFFYATAPVLGVYGAELFATSSRARSAGLVAAASSLGAVAGLLATGALAGPLGALAPALAVLALAPAALVVLVLVAYPESAGVALEDLSPAAAVSSRLVPPARLGLHKLQAVSPKT
ncbi:MAG: MFS transporter [Acidimicrobiales bacterium]